MPSEADEFSLLGKIIFSVGKIFFPVGKNIFCNIKILKFMFFFFAIGANANIIVGVCTKMVVINANKANFFRGNDCFCA